MDKKAIVAGHICIDITPIFPSGKNGRISEILVPGKLIQMGDSDVHTGGAVANTGLAMKKFGIDVTLMGKTGRDEFGEMIGGVLDKHGADARMIRSDKTSTSYSVVLAVPGNDRIFLHNPGANDTFCCSDIPQEALRECALFHFGYPTIMKSMYASEGEELLKMMQMMKQNGIATSLDMAVVDPDSDAGKVDWRIILNKVLPFVDFFMPSIEELGFMLERERFMQWQTRAGGGDIAEILSIEEDVKPLADRCMLMGAKVLLIKCGAPGLYYRTADEEIMRHVGVKAGLDIEKWSGKAGFEDSYEPERLLSGTGAGDACIAAFLSAMLKGREPEMCIHMAAAAGAACVAAYDALSGLPSFEVLEAKVHAGWSKKMNIMNAKTLSS
ncbi:MAG: carbohydrate kinase family protein [Clostridiales Family XIII bacterium]|jgi:sugar/nucleoside kinase (ribokinase family)|nr:carbohydrate kinase family protein [Clostridiales Family XIII bacterium]